MDVLRKVLEHMHAGGTRFAATGGGVGQESGPKLWCPILRSLRLNSLDQVDSLESLKRVVLEVERVAEMTR